VNEQTEIGLLLALPGLLATMVLAPWILQIFYTSEFIGAVESLQWFILGCIGRVISWPLGYIMLALNKSSWLIISETVMHALHILFIYIGLKIFGLAGVAQAFFLLYVLHIILTFFICKNLIYFTWSKSVITTIILSILASMAVLLSCLQYEIMTATIIGLTITTISLLASMVMILTKSQIYRRSKFLVKAKEIVERRLK
jgi:PST family polysaccharide transporter